MANLKNYLLQKTVKPQGLLKTFPLTLKMYSISRDEHPENYIIKATKNLLKAEIDHGKIDPLSGFGFGILSGDILNLIIWGKFHQYEIRIKNQNYMISLAGKNQLIKLNDFIFGSFNAGELGIANYEKNSLIKYLNSPQKPYDLERYLTDMIEGNL